ncbi:hypothetical protein ABT272_43390 [Streptomyces sp900105245]|uniref:Uncharacterized protein n=1 Tax=Streptomyces sp. 900105245 TaxID=3154379 RepID=A0ABV1ULK5_9ACTN
MLPGSISQFSERVERGWVRTEKRMDATDEGSPPAAIGGVHGGIQARGLAADLIHRRLVLEGSVSIALTAAGVLGAFSIEVFRSNQRPRTRC